MNPVDLTPSYLQAPPTSNVSTIGNLPQVDPAAILSASQPSIQGYSSAIKAALTPQFQQQRLGLNEALAAAGISGGSAPGAQAQLGLQQQQQLTGDIQPGILQMLGYGLGAAQGNQQTALAGSEYNAGAYNQGNQFDIGNLIQAALTNAQMKQQASEFGAGLQNQDWLAQLGAANQLAIGGAQGQTGAFEPTFVQPGKVDYNAGGFAQQNYAAPQPQQVPFDPAANYSMQYPGGYSPTNTIPGYPPINTQAILNGPVYHSQAY